MKSAWTGFIRNKLVSFSTVLVITFILVLFHVTQALQFFTEESIYSLNKQVDMIVEVKDDVEHTEILPLMQKIEEIKGIESVNFITKQQALEGFLNRHVNIGVFLKKYKLKNPLPSSLEVVASDAEKLMLVREILQDTKYSSFITQTKMLTDLSQKERIEKLVYFGNLVKMLGYGFILILLSVVILVVFNAINIAIHQKKDEITIMNLVGASKAFIQFPFIFEAIIYAFISFVFAALISLFLHFQLLSMLSDSLIQSDFIGGVQELFQSFLFQYPSLLFQEFFILMLSVIFVSVLAVELYLRRH